MALYDNQHWLLSHIRNSFISSDDTGMCEVVMMSENIPQQMVQTKYSVYPGLGESDDEDDLDMLSQSIDIHSDLQYGLLRHRSNTASKLEKMEQARKKAAQIRIVKWRRNQPDNAMDDNVMNELFKRKDLSSSMKPFQTQCSLLTYQLQKFPHFPKNPYQMYAKYDGNAQVGLSTRKYKIFLHMLPPEQRNYPMEVVIVVGTRVLDLIGLTLWKCFIEYPNIELKDIEFYSLYIAEDDGEVDCDLPSFEVSEFIAKFGFGYLALIEKEIPLNKNKIQVNSDFQHPLKPKIELTDQSEITKMPDGNVLDEVLFHNPWHNLEAPLYQSYRVYMLNKFRTKNEILLGVSGEKIEIDPVLNNKTGSRYIWNKQKAVTYDIDAIVACDLTQNKSNKATFRLVYDQSSELNHVDSVPYGSSLGFTNTSTLYSSNHNYKHYDFEVEYRVADEIVQKINHILDLRSNPKRKDYLAIRENKSHRRKSFTFGPR